MVKTLYATLVLPPRNRPNHVTQPPIGMAAIFLFLWLGSVACASASAVPSPTSEPAGNAASTKPLTDWSSAPPDILIAEIRNKLAATKEALALTKTQTDATSPANVATQEEIVEGGVLQQQMVRIYQRQIDNLLKLKSLQQSRSELGREIAKWAGMPNPPPYSIFKLDELREKVRFLEEHSLALSSMNAATEQESGNRNESLKKANEKLRQANELLEGNAGGDTRLIWLRDMEGLRKRYVESRVEVIRIEQRVLDEELAEIRQRLEFTKRQLGEVKGKVSFTPADKEQVRVRLANERQLIQDEMAALGPLAEDSHQAFDVAAAALDQGRKSLPEGDERLANLEFALERSREQAENADIKFQALNWLIDSVRLREKVWELRWPTADGKDPMAVGQGYAMIAKLKMETAPIQKFLDQRLKLTSEQVYDMKKQMFEPASPLLTSHRQQMHDLFADREASYQRLLGGLELSDHLLDLWKQDLDDRHQSESWSAKAQEWWAQVREAGLQLWQFEFFAVEDTIEVEGQPITGKRSVTVGKVATALSILFVGLWVSSKLTRLTEHIAVTRRGIDASSARIARRWVLFLIGVILVMTSFVMVKIPLTVFAFTGGALAIGAGFGMQNLLKNLISGLMLLLERPFRPGDLVEVGGIRGRVIDIGMRSSHFRDGNGIETLIPNSTFVEENVTNWTLSSQSVRIVVKLGVAYDSPVQKLTELLLETAIRHGLVQDKPAPQVLFEDFGSDALQFGLYVWVEIKRDVDWRSIASDLRFMIHKTLSANGIVMAFPQRDIHVDTAQPLQVKLL